MHDTMAQCAISTRRPQVVEQLDELANALDDLSKATEELESKLSKVTREEPETPKNSAVAPSENLVNLAMYVRELRWRAKHIEYRINRLNNCLEI